MVGLKLLQTRKLKLDLTSLMSCPVRFMLLEKAQKGMRDEGFKLR